MTQTIRQQTLLERRRLWQLFVILYFIGRNNFTEILGSGNKYYELWLQIWVQIQTSPGPHTWVSHCYDVQLKFIWNSFEVNREDDFKLAYLSFCSQKIRPILAPTREAERLREFCWWNPTSSSSSSTTHDARRSGGSSSQCSCSL